VTRPAATLLSPETALNMSESEVRFEECVNDGSTWLMRKRLG
jgi:hypothetical protein